MKICLIVLSPRVLPIAEEAFAKLPVDQFWIKNYTETQIEKLGIIKNFVDSTNYDYYDIESDDSIVPLASWNALIDVLKTSGKLLPVLSGWAEINEKCKRANLRLKAPPFQSSLFHWIHKVKIISRATSRIKKLTFPYPQDLPEGIFRTYFVGWSITAIRRDILQRFPYQYHTGSGSDYPFAYRCNINNVPMYALKEAQVFHLDANYGWRTTEPTTELIKWQEPIIQSS